MASGYEDKTGFVECEFLVSIMLGRGKVPVTLAMDTIVIARSAMGYRIIHGTRRGAGVNGTKAYPTIRIPNNDTNWGYPKRKRRKAIAIGLEYFARVRSFRSSPRRLMAATWRREAVDTR